MNYRKMKKIGVFLLAAALVMTSVPVSAVSADEDVSIEMMDASESGDDSVAVTEETGYENLALKSTATMDQPEFVSGADHSSKNAVDGNLGTYAQAADGQAFNLTLEFPEPTKFNQAVMLEGGRVQDFTLSVSDDGEDWSEVAKYVYQDGKDYSNVVVDFDPVTATYLKLTMDELRETWPAIAELEVYNLSQVPVVKSNVANYSILHKGDTVELEAVGGASVYYTTDGSDPLNSDTAQEYTEPIQITDDVTIRTYAKKDGLADSDVTDYVYYMQYIEATPEPGSIEADTEVALECLMDGADIYYTTDGSDPVEAGDKYTGSIAINGFTEIRAYCKMPDGSKTSQVYSFVYATGNTAADAVITASSSVGNFGPENAVDGDGATCWKTDKNKSWIQLDFQVPYDFSYVNIEWLNEDAGYQYVVETSWDLTHWYTYYDQSAGADAKKVHSIPNMESHRRYMRVYVFGSSKGKEIGISEITIGGKASEEGAKVPMYDQDEVTTIYDRPVINPIPDAAAGVEESVINLNGEWKFAMDPPNGFWRDSVEPTDWDTIRVPGDPDIQGFLVHDNHMRNKEIVYKQKFVVPEDYEGQNAFLRISRALSYARVWVNGHFVREHRGDYTSWDAEITDFMKPGEENWITISVVKEVGTATSNFEYMAILGAGIMGDISMYATPENHLNRLHYKTYLDDDYEDATLKVMTNAFLEEGKTGVIKLSMKDMNGNEVRLSENTIAVEENFTDYSLEIPVENPDKWDAEHPNLYEVTADFEVDGNVVETVTQKIGFREIEVKKGEADNNRIYVNGVAVKLRGVNYLTAYGTEGNSYGTEVSRMFLEKAKTMNVNYIRAAHYPVSTEVLELCDELGIYVEQENSCHQKGGGPGGEPRYRNYVLDACAGMVEEDMSHPSIIMWSVANESDWGSNHDASSRYIKAVDPDIPTKFSWGRYIPRDAAIDIQSNHYKMDGVGLHGRATVWDEYAHNNMGYADAETRIDPGFRYTYYGTIHHNWEQVYNDPGSSGGAIWDYLDMRDEGPSNNHGCSWGMLDVWGKEKPEYWGVKTAYSPVQYKGEETVNRPGKDKALALTYENRYDTVSFNDRDFEIYYSVNGGENQPLTSELAPKETGTIEIPVPADGWKWGDKIRVEFYKTTNEYRRIVVADEITFGQANYTVADAKGPAPEISEDETSFTVKGDNFQIDFSKETGKITNGSYNGETVLVGGPNLNVNLNDPEAWTKESITAEIQENEAVVTIAGIQGSTPCTFNVKIDTEGKIATTYAMKNGRFNTYEMGISYDLPADAEKISWISNGYSVKYQDNQACSPTGTAYKEIEEKRIRGVKPSDAMGWKDYDTDYEAFGNDDPGGRGTNDFRGSKIGLYYAEMGYAGSDTVLSVYGGEGEGSIRAVMNPDKSVRLNINNAWGWRPLSGLAMTPDQYASIPANYSNTVTIKLSDTTNNYEVKHTPSAANNFIKAIDVEAGSRWSNEQNPVNLINNSGMSGTDSFGDTHDNISGASTMWHTAAESADSAWVQVDLGQVYPLNEMWIWNFNQYAVGHGNLHERGFKNVKIEYSEDGKEWTALTTDMEFEAGDEAYPFQFACGDGSMQLHATNLNDGNNTPVSFNGANARYVKLTAKPVIGEGNWGGDVFGLSELRFTEVDKTKLQNLYDDNSDKNAEEYTEESWAVFNAAMQAALKVLNDDAADKEAVEAAIVVLEEAIKGLVPEEKPIPVNKAELQSLYENNTDKNAEDYTEKSWAVFDAAMKAAEKILSSDTATQDEVDAEVQALRDAIAQLAETEADIKEALKRLYEANAAREESKYTADSWKAFAEAMEAAKKVLEAPDAAQEQVDAVYAALVKASADLVQKPKPEPIVKVTGVKLSPTKGTLYAKGAVLKVKASVLPQNASNQGITWKSNNKKVATVEANGKVTAVANGKADIYATTKDGHKTAKFTVTVKIVKKPAKVTGIKVKETAKTCLKVSWNKVKGADSYKVYIYKENKKWHDFLTTKKTGMTITGLVPGSKYEIKVAAVNKGGRSAYSKGIETATRPLRTTLNTAKKYKAGQVKLSYKKVSGCRYVVYMKSGNGSYKRVANTSKTSVVIKGLKKGKTYSFKVRTYIKNDGKNYYGSKSNTLKCKAR